MRGVAPQSPKVASVHTNIYPNYSGDPSVHGFVEVVDERCARRVVDESKSRSLKVQGMDQVNVKRAKSRIDMNRDWALRRAEEMIKDNSLANGKDVKQERGSDKIVRGIYVNGIRVFEQIGRYSKDGTFLHEFAALRLR